MKRRIKIVAIFMTIAVLCGVLAGCSLVSTNTERQAGRVMASVNVDLVKEFGNDVKVLGNDWDYNVSLTVTRREVISTVNYAINYYSQLYQQYGYTYSYEIDTLVESAINTLQTEKYTAIISMGQLLKNAATSGRLDALYCLTDEYQTKYGKTLVPEGVLTIAERYDAISSVNENMQSSIDKYVETYTKDERDTKVSAASDELSALYEAGYFVDSVTLGYLNDAGEFVQGVYKDYVIDDNDEDTKDLNYEKIYGRYTLIKYKDGAKVKGDDDKYIYGYVNMPIDSNDLTLAEKEDADFVDASITTKIATITMAGRVYQAPTDEDKTGYGIVSFTSDEEEYYLVAPRSKYVAPEEDEDEALETLRYTTRAAWADEANYTEEMKDFKQEIFKTTLDEYASDVEKNAYRQLRNDLSSNNVGYITSDPGKDDEAGHFNYVYFKGLQYYYDSQFISEVTSAAKAEVIEGLTISDEEIAQEYALLVAQDATQYVLLSEEEQVKKFFTTIKTDLTSVYYVPIEALKNTTFEVDPSKKEYDALFTKDGNGVVTDYNATYVTYDNVNDVYTMPYAFDNNDGTYTINMFYVAHILIKLDNVDGLSTQLEELYKDFSEEQKYEFIKMMCNYIETCPQLLSFLDNYDKDDVEDYTVSDVFETEVVNEVTTFKKYSLATVKTTILNALNGAIDSYDDVLEAFKLLMIQYNDDSGALSGSGYLISAGDMENSWMADFTAIGLQIYFNSLVNHTAITELDNGETSIDGYIGEAYTSYGLHIMMISFDPLQNIAVDTCVVDGKNYTGVGLNTELNLDGDTKYESLKDSLLTNKESKTYDTWKNGKVTDETVASHTVKNEKNLKALLSDLDNK